MPVIGSTVTYSGKPARILQVIKDNSGNPTKVWIRQSGKPKCLSYSAYQAGIS